MHTSKKIEVSAWNCAFTDTMNDVHALETCCSLWNRCKTVQCDATTSPDGQNNPSLHSGGEFFKSWPAIIWWKWGQNEHQTQTCVSWKRNQYGGSADVIIRKLQNKTKAGELSGKEIVTDPGATRPPGESKCKIEVKYCIISSYWVPKHLHQEIESAIEPQLSKLIYLRLLSSVVL